jgi:hypothetical protein
MTRIFESEISEHDQLILMMARYFKNEGYTQIKADIPDWPKPDKVFWTNDPNNPYIPDLTCYDNSGIYVILEAETCSTLNITHTQEQFKIFRAHATKNKGRFEVVVPINCNNRSASELIKQQAREWNIILDNIWTPSA